MMTRWDEWFSEENLTKDARILSAPPSLSAEKAARAFKVRRKQFILDLACGVGRDTFYLESQGFTVIGVDASFNGLQVAQRVKMDRGATSELICSDARHLPFKEGSFEGVYCFGLLHEFTSEHQEEDVGKVMGEISRLLRDEGVLVISVLSGDPQEGLPEVQLFSRKMFEKVTKDLRAIEIKMYDDVGCTGKTDYHVWYGVFER